MSRGLVYGLRRRLCGGRRLQLPLRLSGGGPMPHSIERQRMVGDGLELRQRRRAWMRLRSAGTSGSFKPQAQRRVAGRTHLAARAIPVEPGGKFVAPAHLRPPEQPRRANRWCRAASADEFSSEPSAATACAAATASTASLSIRCGSKAPTDDAADPDSTSGLHCDEAGGRGSNGQRQTSPHSGQFMKTSLLKSYQFAPGGQPEGRQRES